MDFASFLSDNKDQALATQAPVGALDAPKTDPFESFMRTAKGEQDQNTLQQAQQTTVVNAQQGSAKAAQAAPVARQLGLPQPAVEADLGRFQTQAKTEQNSALLAQNPVLAKWVAANPDSARIAGDEYDKLSSIEKLWEGTKGVGYAGLQGLAGAYNSAALGVNRQIGNLLTVGGFGPNTASDWWRQTMIDPRAQAQSDLTLAPDAGIGAKAANVVGNLAGLLSQITFAGGGGEAADAGASALTAVAEAAKTAGKTMAFPAMVAATNKGQEVFDKTGDQSLATKAAIAEYLFSTAQGVIPFSAPGGILRRVTSGALSGVSTSEGQRAAMNLLMPESMQQKFDPQEALFQAMSGAVLGGVMGPRGEPNYHSAIRQTYTDALKAEQAERDIGKVAALGEISAKSNLREADPDAFKTFVETVSDRSNLEAVYIDPKMLTEALAQSKVDLSQMPDVAKQLAEGEATGTDVRIPVADFATHIAGTDLEKALIPNLKAAPDGMTFKEGQAFYQDAAKNMTDRAKEMAKQKEVDTALEQDRQNVYQTVYTQLTEAGREPGVAKTEAALHEAFYSTLAESLGIKPSEAAAKYGAQIGSESPTAGGLAEEKRGAYSPPTATIALLKDADLSTFAHESGHHFLEVMRRVADSKDAPEGIKADFDALLKRWKVEGATPEERLDNWSLRNVDQQRAGHEDFAKSFEKYLMEGKAPTQALQPIFSRFRSWLINVYKSLRGLNVELSPEVRGVFDRLLASENAIKETEQMRSYAPLFDNAKAAGMSLEDFNSYLAQGQSATDAALSSMQAKSMQDMKWASNAKSKALRALQKQADAARKEVRAQVENQVNEMRVFKLKDYLASIKNYDPEIVANSYGFEDAHHMEQTIEAAGDKNTVIDALTDQRMLQEHGELTDPQAIETAANDAVHNEARARFMATGLKILTKSPIPANQIAKAAKEAAESAIAQKQAGDLNVQQYLNAESKANKEALASAAKDPAKAIQAQREAILNNRLAKAAQEAKDQIQKGLDYFKKFDSLTTAKAIGADYMDRINELLSQYDVTGRMASKSDVEARVQMREWLNSEFDRTGVMPEVSDALLDFAQRRSWKELTVEEFRGLVDSIKSMEHVGREATQVTVNGQKVALAELVDRAKADMSTLPHSDPIDVQPHMLHATGLDKLSALWLNAKQKVRGMDAAVVKMEQLFQWLTQGSRAGLGAFKTGPFLEMFQRAGNAEGAERAMRADSAKDLKSLGKELQSAGVNLNEKLNLPLMRKGRGNQWYREELIAAALNTGNAGNLKKLTEGYGWNERTLMDTLDKHLSTAEWKFVQGVWDAVGKYGQQISDLQRRQTGVTPEMVKAQKITNSHGEFEGGYYPVVYDAFQDTKIDTKQAKNTDLLFENQWSKPTTNKGHTIARTGYVGPIDLSLGVISRHLDQVTHDLAWREAIVDMNKFLSHPEITSEVDQVMGREYRKQFRPWLQAMANDKVFNTAGDTAWERFYRTARTNATLVGLGFRLSTMLIHGSSAMSNSIGEIGTKYFAKGASEFATPERWEKAKAFMYERSPEMANRFNTMDRNIHEAIDQINEHEKSLGPISATQKAVDGARRFAFYGVSALDMGSAAPTWMGAYIKGMDPQAKGGLGMSEEAAIDYANRAVRNAHGGGGVKDLSAVQRDKGVMSIATMFYSFWNHMYNRQRDLAKGYGNLGESFKSGTGTRDFAKLLARSWWYFVVPQLIHAYLKPDNSKENDGSLEHSLLHMAEEVGLGFVSGVPVLRDLANAVVNGRDYTITPLEQAGKSIVKATVDTYKYATGQEPSMHAGKNAVQAAGYVAGLPTGQLSGTGSFLWDVYNGDADPQGIHDWYTGIQNGRISEY